MGQLICKCCGKEARWCGDGENACGTDGCDINPFSSRCCEKGTKSCEVRHNADVTGAAPNGKETKR